MANSGPLGPQAISALASGAASAAGGAVAEKVALTAWEKLFGSDAKDVEHLINEIEKQIPSDPAGLKDVIKHPSTSAFLKLKDNGQISQETNPNTFTGVVSFGHGETRELLKATASRIAQWAIHANKGGTHPRNQFVAWFMDQCKKAATDPSSLEGLAHLKFLKSVLSWALKHDFTLSSVTGSRHIRDDLRAAYKSLDSALTLAELEANSRAGVQYIERINNASESAFRESPKILLNTLCNCEMKQDLNYRDLCRGSALRGAVGEAAAPSFLVAAMQQLVGIANPLDDELANNAEPIARTNQFISALGGKRLIVAAGSPEAIAQEAAKKRGDLGTQVFANNLAGLVLSPDGKEISYTYNDENQQKKTIKIPSGFGDEICDNRELLKAVWTSQIKILKLIDAMSQINRMFESVKEYAKNFGDFGLYVLASKTLDDLIPLSKTIWKELQEEQSKLHDLVNNNFLSLAGDVTRGLTNRSTNLTQAEPSVRAFNGTIDALKANMDLLGNSYSKMQQRVKTQPISARVEAQSLLTMFTSLKARVQSTGLKFDSPTMELLQKPQPPAESLPPNADVQFGESQPRQAALAGGVVPGVVAVPAVEAVPPIAPLVQIAQTFRLNDKDQVSVHLNDSDAQIVDANIKKFKGKQTTDTYINSVMQKHFDPNNKKKMNLNEYKALVHNMKTLTNPRSITNAIKSLHSVCTKLREGEDQTAYSRSAIDERAVVRAMRIQLCREQINLLIQAGQIPNITPEEFKQLGQLVAQNIQAQILKGAMRGEKDTFNSVVNASLKDLEKAYAETLNEISMRENMKIRVGNDLDGIKTALDTYKMGRATGEKHPNTQRAIYKDITVDAFSFQEATEAYKSRKTYLRAISELEQNSRDNIMGLDQKIAAAKAAVVSFETRLENRCKICATEIQQTAADFGRRITELTTALNNPNPSIREVDQAILTLQTLIAEFNQFKNEKFLSGELQQVWADKDWYKKTIDAIADIQAKLDELNPKVRTFGLQFVDAENRRAAEVRAAELERANQARARAEREAIEARARLDALQNQRASSPASSPQLGAQTPPPASVVVIPPLPPTASPLSSAPNIPSATPALSPTPPPIDAELVAAQTAVTAAAAAASQARKAVIQVEIGEYKAADALFKGTVKTQQMAAWDSALTSKLKARTPLVSASMFPPKPKEGTVISKAVTESASKITLVLSCINQYLNDKLKAKVNVFQALATLPNPPISFTGYDDRGVDMKDFLTTNRGVGVIEFMKKHFGTNDHDSYKLMSLLAIYRAALQVRNSSEEDYFTNLNIFNATLQNALQHFAEFRDQPNRYSGSTWSGPGDFQTYLAAAGLLMGHPESDLTAKKKDGGYQIDSNKVNNAKAMVAQMTPSSATPAKSTPHLGGGGSGGGFV